jgi:hypothetical protein
LTGIPEGFRNSRKREVRLKGKEGGTSTGGDFCEDSSEPKKALHATKRTTAVRVTIWGHFQNVNQPACPSSTSLVLSVS